MNHTQEKKIRMAGWTRRPYRWIRRRTRILAFKEQSIEGWANGMPSVSYAEEVSSTLTSSTRKLKSPRP